MTLFIEQFPQPLLDALCEGRVFPYMGSGFSKNAVTPPGTSMPNWNELGRYFANQLPGKPANIGAVDAMSTFEYLYGRAQLTQELFEVLLIGKARPGEAHRAFARLPFDLVVTTNLDFLFEEAYDQVGKFARPVMYEDQLSIDVPDDVVLLKFHGDVNNPDRMIVTENDFDTIFERYPLVITYLSSLFINGTPLFIGYSADDPDFRQIFEVVRERLGGFARQAFALLPQNNQAGPPEVELLRFQRRGITPIILGGPTVTLSFSQIFTQTFEEIQAFLETCPQADGG